MVAQAETKFYQQPSFPRNMRSFLHIDTDSHFTLHNIPFGIFSTQKEASNLKLFRAMHPC